MIKLSKILAFFAALALANLIIYLCFLFAVFGQLNLFYSGIGVLNLLVCGLTLRAVFTRRENRLWTGLEFIVYGLVAVSARLVITDIALVISGAFILAGILALLGSRFARKPKPQESYWG